MAQPAPRRFILTEQTSEGETTCQDFDLAALTWRATHRGGYPRPDESGRIPAPAARRFQEQYPAVVARPWSDDTGQHVDGTAWEVVIEDGAASHRLKGQVPGVATEDQHPYVRFQALAGALRGQADEPAR